ncbi:MULTISPECIES: hypothetical protein [unclassified Acinetobacter]|uniref:hypothetical protein n=1 Tax=unclassified Acinetobacter TaxID=196816 RepID=UPI0020B3856C|nr:MULTISPECIES: hypothetical protein [unclassified Acinetobacter]
MSIHDNGIGFDAEMVQKNGLSIGMRSMKIRVERMRGLFQIESEQENTVIYVVLELYKP